MKILLGGIPLGCDNIGDEAILACVVKMLRESLPGVELAVATAVTRNLHFSPPWWVQGQSRAMCGGQRS